MVKWNQHNSIDGKHAFLAPSNATWLNYDSRKLAEVYDNAKLKEKGTMLHAWASIAIQEGFKMANHKKAINQFVNDAIGFGMRSEQLLMYSDNCFGTADAIKYHENEKLLRVHDLKTGIHKADFRQLFVYCALFCLEYRKDPYQIDFECRIYQGSGYESVIGDPDYIKEIMNIIMSHDVIINSINEGA